MKTLIKGQKMNIGVMGATGFVGSHLIQKLTEKSRVRGFSSSVIIDSLNIMKGDYANPDHLKKFSEDLKVLIYAAGTVDPRLSSDIEYHSIRKKLIEELDLCLKTFFESNKQGQFIFFSSAGALYSKSFDETNNELSPLEPTGFYGELKVSQEELIKQYYGDKNIVIIRPSNIFGDPFKKNKKTGIIDRIIASSLKGDTVDIFENLNSERDYIYIEDLVTAINCCVFDTKLSLGETVKTFNISSNIEIKLRDLIDETFNSFNKPPAKICYTKLNTEPNCIKIDSSKFRKLTGWENHYSLSQALEHLKLKIEMRKSNL
jgi:UDP-glucose 4-epimerase